jgi:hypothetical protein
MNALPSELLRQTAELSESATRPIPGSRKVHIEGSRADVRVPMREIALADTPSMFGAEKNAPFTTYDTSGPYTDPDYRVDLTAGLPALRARWIAERGDSEQLADFTSPFTPPCARAVARRRAVPEHSEAAHREIRHEHLADALRASRHRHAGNGIHRDPRESAHRSDPRGASAQAASGPIVRRGDSETHHAGVRAR